MTTLACLWHAAKYDMLTGNTLACGLGSSKKAAGLAQAKGYTCSQCPKLLE